MTGRKTGYAPAIAVLFCLAALSSSLLILVEADHDCVGNDCEVCALISVCASAFKFLGTAAPLALYAVITSTALLPDRTARVAAAPSTLITMKVKLSD